MDLLLNALRVAGLIFLVLLVFNLMIVVHEWGHFLAARWRGLKVEKFYVWFGKPIWKKKINGVEYGLGSIPMGGFVALPQMAPMDAIEGKTEEGREVLPPITPLDKIIVAFAGPLFSFLLAVLFAVVVWKVGLTEHQIDTEKRIGYVAKGSPAERDGLKVGDEILTIDGNKIRGFRGLVESVTWYVVSSENDVINFKVNRPGVGEMTIPVKSEKPKQEGKTSWWTGIFTRPAFRQVGIGPVMTLKVEEFASDGEHTPAQEGGMKKGDILRTINGEKVLSNGVLGDILEKNVGKPMAVEVERDGKMVLLTITPRLPDQRPADFNLEQESIATLGVSVWDILGPEKKRFPSPLSQIKDAGRTIYDTLRKLSPTSKSDIGASHLSGFIGIANVYYNLLQDPNGWERVLWFSVVLNVNLALLNMLPFPVLDGGHIVMALYEWVRRKSINLRILEVVQTACVILLFGFMIFISFKDTGDVIGVGRKGDDVPAERVPSKFLAPEKRVAH
ncbi:RIP metalloprotease RseP [Roseimicrobium sp. ORNL1]|uniref:RIP metalloprotease RseP n=1 Tax=Roseimicrobium sp. ORNL1 TaxID=2711231 RepID=UPI0013E13D65|nr:RIP metalloprotease RseP [Roseimicrobium sp. ORNL1]QIF05602.1 RIP metalloprotease RseP [Roseimicrobium sp. ORNL1]